MHACVILYGDKVTDSMNKAIGETKRRRTIQIEYNKIHNIVPRSVCSSIDSGIEQEIIVNQAINKVLRGHITDQESSPETMEQIHRDMLEAADQLDFERAAKLRDQLAVLQGQAVAMPQKSKTRRKRH